MWHSVADGGSRIEESKLTKKERDPHWQELWLKEHQKLNPEDSTSCLRTLKPADTLEAAQAMNAEKESERSLREP